jgi:uroporphyrinogen-III synthase
VDELGATFVPLYRTRAIAPLERPEGDLVVLASASAARALGALDLALPAVSIGPQTTAAARAAGVEIVAEAETHDLAGLLAAVTSRACSSAS